MVLYVTEINGYQKSSLLKSHISYQLTNLQNYHFNTTNCAIHLTQFESTVKEDLQSTVSKYVEIYCTENTAACMPTENLVRTIESVAFGQATEDDAAMFLSLESRLVARKKMHGIQETHHYRVMQQNVTVE